ncbi:MAG: hypothetical protein OXE96_06705 [Gemmatimonadetes bacterium]|nr:hypothetical protein [Gemmatimonadota bacterium]
MSDFDRFVEFVRREGMGYNEPPETPGEAMWGGVEARLVGQLYHVPPVAPREEMWKVIEAAWVSRESPGVIEIGGRRQPGQSRGSLRRWPVRPRWWTRRGNAAGWATALTVAASLVLGLALGRGTRTTQPFVGSADHSVATPASEPETAFGVPAAEPQATRSGEDPALHDQLATTSDIVRAAPVVEPSRAGGEPEAGVVDGSYLEVPAVLRDPFDTEDHYPATQHLGRAATLLTAFRIDQGTPGSQQDLARWARELLGDTRAFLDMPGSRSPQQYALLEDLELVLIQIARLGPEAPEFEWQLARESMEWQGTLTRLRVASDLGEI